MDYAKHLIERIASLDPQDDRVGVLANELLREFQRGYALDDLRKLLRSEDEHLVAIAVWITSELGVKCRPLIGDVLPMLAHPRKGIRFDALNCVFWILPQNGCDLTKAIYLIGDSEDGIRRKVLDILSRLSREQIEAAYRCTHAEWTDSSQRDGLGWLLSSDALDPKQVISALQNPQPVIRKYGAVAAARLRDTQKEPLTYASKVNDDDVSTFANRLLA